MIVKNKVFVVTGAGSGMGKEITTLLLEKGAKVAAVDLRPEGLAALKEELGKKAENLSTHILSVSDKEAVEKLPKAVIAAHGAVDALINNAGIIQPFVRVNDLDFDSVERVMGVNFYGLLYMTKAFLPHLLERPEGYVANVSSMGGFLPVPGQSVYGASKAAVKLLTEGLYAELLDTKVNVSIVFPGAINTNISANSGIKMEAPKSGAKAQKFKMTSPQEAAKIIVTGIEKNQPQIFVGGDSKFLNTLYRLNPVFATKFIAKQMKSLLAQSEKEKVVK